VARGGRRGDRAAHGGHRPQVPYRGGEGIGRDVDSGAQPDEAADSGAAARRHGQWHGAGSAVRQRAAQPARADEIASGAARDPAFGRVAGAERPRIAPRIREPDRGMGPLAALTAGQKEKALETFERFQTSHNR